jgi:hypothetical protein
MDGWTGGWVVGLMVGSKSLSSRLLSENIKSETYKTYKFYQSLCMVVKSGLSHYGKNRGWGVFENRVLNISTKRGELTGDLRKLHNKQLYNLYCTSNIIWMIK